MKVGTLKLFFISATLFFFLLFILIYRFEIAMEKNISLNLIKQSTFTINLFVGFNVLMGAIVLLRLFNGNLPHKAKQIFVSLVVVMVLSSFSYLAIAVKEKNELLLRGLERGLFSKSK